MVLPLNKMKNRGSQTGPKFDPIRRWFFSILR